MLPLARGRIGREVQRLVDDRQVVLVVQHARVSRVELRVDLGGGGGGTDADPELHRHASSSGGRGMVSSARTRPAGVPSSPAARRTTARVARIARQALSRTIKRTVEFIYTPEKHQNRRPINSLSLVALKPRDAIDPQKCRGNLTTRCLAGRQGSFRRCPPRARHAAFGPYLVARVTVASRERHCAGSLTPWHECCSIYKP